MAVVKALWHYLIKLELIFCFCQYLFDESSLRYSFAGNLQKVFNKPHELMLNLSVFKWQAVSYVVTSWTRPPTRAVLKTLVATIRIRQEIKCLPYARFINPYLHVFKNATGPNLCVLESSGGTDSESNRFQFGRGTLEKISQSRVQRAWHTIRRIDGWTYWGQFLVYYRIPK